METNQNQISKKEIKGTMVFLLVVLLLATLIAIPFITWQFKKAMPIKVLILDKTVPVKNYREHRNIMWILNNRKFLNYYTGKYFETDKDYTGFFPYPENEDSKQDYHIKGLDKKLDGDIDLIYLADTYGVYTDDFKQEKPEGERSELIYGGLSSDEIKSIKENLPGKTIIGEFNIFNSPTEMKEREEAGRIFGLQWTGWIFRWFPDLSRDNPEIPGWMIRNYESQYNKEWGFKGPGFAYVNDDDSIFILEDKIHVNENGVKVFFDENTEKEFGVKSGVNYYYWCEVVKAEGQVLGSFQIDVTEEGKKLLEMHGLGTRYPALVKTDRDYKSYYFACDAADNNEISFTYRVNWYSDFMKLMPVGTEGSGREFFWKIYSPFMNHILDTL